MGKGNPNKPRGKMSLYAFFRQTCQEEHKKKHPDSSVNFAKFSKKCSERWKTTSAKEKSKFEDMAKICVREMKNCVLPKGDKKGKKIPTLLRDHHLPSSCFALNIAQRSKVNTQACPLGIVQMSWVKCGLSSQHRETAK
ncbi:High mobility group protein B1 [Sciurus carolinensis]|uniref:High mobility group protein B1 n=1 Tax=Sciurus carolinensis TaxID=30640 RepID=A0AA41SVE7_SCICA|nr:High mobility group protein B1 [Sciurus carolinensis]